MSDPLLDPNESPSALRPDAGVRRLSQWPLRIVALVAIVIVLVFVFFIRQRAEAPDQPVSVVPSENESPVVVPDAQRGYETVIAGFEEVNEIEAVTQAAPEPLVAEPVVEIVAPIEPPPSELDKRLERAKEHQFDLYRDAVAAETTFPVDIYSSVSENLLSDNPFAALDQLGSMRDQHVDDLLERVTGGLADPNLRGRKEAFANSEADFGYSIARPRPALSKYELNVGSIIPAILITAINSDLPGLIKAQVSKPVYDSRSGEMELVPRGSLLIGRYDNVVARGQQRVMIAWDRLQFPDGATFNLGNMPGVDAAGAAGVADKVDNHYWRTFGNATLLSMISATAQKSQPQSAVTGAAYSVSSQEQLAAELGRNWSEVGEHVIKQNMQIQPTLRIRAGFRFSVMVNKDLILEPVS